ncbi:MAG: tetratricopeptide repeat protein [Candidatus Wallbacteria bacterium]|nr:tetratricopeptide repeat protein [Candidatus Wallbacteria bacterium]
MQKDKETFPDFQNMQGIRAYEEGKTMQAIKYFKQAISLNQTYVEAYVNLGVTYSDSGLKDDAVKAFERAYLLDPNYMDTFGLTVTKREEATSAHKRMALEYMNKNQFQDALMEIEIACRKKPNYPDYYNIRGVILIKLKRFEEALESIKKALELNPEYDSAKSNLALIHYYRGLHYFETGLEMEAVKEWKRSLIIDPVKSLVKLHLNQEKDKITMRITCPGCKEMLNLDWKYCPYCGSKRRQDATLPD